MNFQKHGILQRNVCDIPCQVTLYISLQKFFVSKIHIFSSLWKISTKLHNFTNCDMTNFIVNFSFRQNKYFKMSHQCDKGLYSHVGETKQCLRACEIALFQSLTLFYVILRHHFGHSKMSREKRINCILSLWTVVTCVVFSLMLLISWWDPCGHCSVATGIPARKRWDSFYCECQNITVISGSLTSSVAVAGPAFFPPPAFFLDA
jgi:hypothetical protein